MGVMTNILAKEEVQEWILSPLDKCDRCNAEALVRVTGMSGDLLFCGHHYNKIMAIPDGYNSMMAFMISIVDERKNLLKIKQRVKTTNDYSDYWPTWFW